MPRKPDNSDFGMVPRALRFDQAIPPELAGQTSPRGGSRSVADFPRLECMSDLLHRCRQGKRCKARSRTPANEWLACGVERPDSLCRACEESAFDAIRELAGDYSALSASLTEERAKGLTPKVSGTADPSIPLPLAIEAQMTAIDDELLRWFVRVTGGDPTRRSQRDRVALCCQVVCANLGTLVDSPRRRCPALMPLPDGGDFLGAEELDGVDAVLRLAKLHHQSLGLLGLVETTTFLPDPCPHCARKALAVSKDQERVMCQGCRIVWDSAHFALLSNVLDFERGRVREAVLA